MLLVNCAVASRSLIGGHFFGLQSEIDWQGLICVFAANILSDIDARDLFCSFRRFTTSRYNTSHSQCIVGHALGSTEVFVENDGYIALVGSQVYSRNRLLFQAKTKAQLFP